MPEKVLYTAEATSTGDGRNGHVTTSDGRVDLDLAIPQAMGGTGAGANPEELFAAGYAACFHSALRVVAGREHAPLGDSTVTAEVGIGPEEGGFGLAGEAPTGDVDAEPMTRQPGQAVQHRLPGAGTALRLVHRGIVMIDRHPDGQLLAVTISQCQQCVTVVSQRLHRVGQHQRLQATRQHVFQHPRQFGVHERLAAGKADQFRRQSITSDLVEVAGHLGAGQVGQPVVTR